MLAVGSREPWTLALLTFESLLVGREGPAFYNDYLHGKLKADDPRVLRTLDAVLELAPTMNADHAKLNWLQAMELVVRGQASTTPRSPSPAPSTPTSSPRMLSRCPSRPRTVRGPSAC